MHQSTWGSFGDGQRCMEFSAQGHTLTTINLCKWLVGNYHPLYEEVMEFIDIKNLWNEVVVSVTQGIWKVMACVLNLSSYEELSGPFWASQTGLQPNQGEL